MSVRLQLGIDGRLEALERVPTGILELPLRELVEPRGRQFVLLCEARKRHFARLQYVMQRISDVM